MIQSLSHLSSYFDYQKRVFNKIGQNHFVNKSVVDLGCGFGENTVLISQLVKKVIGVDLEIFPSWRRYTGKNISFLQADAGNLPFKDSVFDVVYARNLLHHVKDRNRVILEMKRVVKKGGKIIIAEGNRYNPVFWIHMTKILKHEHLTQKQFIAMIKKHLSNAHFSSFEAQYFPTKFEIIHLIERLWERIVEKINFAKSILSYNVAVVDKVLK